ncbi:hypothetical protein HBH70_082020 [Parastagonospora nodorum]|nr:hypothetical protein HBH53_055450 [Parastagonospora nodorum]KAH3981602.1 hypothetical protein HBH51_039680 [Parastagonospora nodorum]KAH4045524.1 hypothetical protein HBH49_198750 [Parastagonospora nodorum]KAH4069508.1 hypothetical protein HBH50_099980 [Parastagonospora nodorum]KAH4089917.1 hypothetical protein HBH48_103760 [Parastagonospora nodorum]
MGSVETQHVKVSAEGLSVPSGCRGGIAPGLSLHESTPCAGWTIFKIPRISQQRQNCFDTIRRQDVAEYRCKLKGFAGLVRILAEPSQHDNSEYVNLPQTEPSTMRNISYHHFTSHVASTQLHRLRSPGTSPPSADLLSQ